MGSLAAEAHLPFVPRYRMFESTSPPELTVFPNGKHDDQVDSTAQFLDWLKKPFPSQGFFEFMRRQAEAAEQHRKPQPFQTTWAIGSMEWLAEQKKSR